MGRLRNIRLLIDLIRAPNVVPGFDDPVAAKLRTALESRDWDTARGLLSPVTDPDDLIFYVNICADVDGVQDWIGEKIAAEPGSTLPLLIQGARNIAWAWEARTAARARLVSREQFELFYRRLKTAEDCLDEVIERNPDDVTARALLLTTGRGRHVDRTEQQQRLGEVIRRHPLHWYAHRQMLQYLCKKWYGSHNEMFEFARTAAAKAPDGSPLPTLVAEAHIERWLEDLSAEDTDSEAALHYLQRSDVLAELNAAADRSVRHPDYVRRPGWPGPHNTFAFCFVFAEDWPAADEQFRAIGNLVAASPWERLGNAPHKFVAARYETRQHLAGRR
jgi:hypothetical protein